MQDSREQVRARCTLAAAQGPGDDGWCGGACGPSGRVIEDRFVQITHAVTDAMPRSIVRVRTPKEHK